MGLVQCDHLFGCDYINIRKLVRCNVGRCECNVGINGERILNIVVCYYFSVIWFLCNGVSVIFAL